MLYVYARGGDGEPTFGKRLVSWTRDTKIAAKAAFVLHQTQFQIVSQHFLRPSTLFGAPSPGATTTDVVLFFALTHFFVVAASIVQPGATAPLLEFNDVFNPSKDSQAAFMNMVTNYPNFVAEEWSHVLTWDLFVGRWIWLDGLKRGA